MCPLTELPTACGRTEIQPSQAVETADEVIKIALIKELKPTEWTEVEKITETKKDDKSQASIQ